MRVHGDHRVHDHGDPGDHHVGHHLDDRLSFRNSSWFQHVSCRTTYAATGAMRAPQPLLQRGGPLPFLLFLDPLGRFSRLLWGFYGWDPRGEGGDDTPVLAVGLFERSNAVL